MNLILDVSVAAAAFFPDEMHPVALSVLERLREGVAFVPMLWWYELRNTLLVCERRGRIKEPDTAEILVRLSKLPLSHDQRPDETQVLRLARSHGLSVYDAAYLELALRERLPLATFEGALRRAAAAEGVALLTP